MKIDPMQYFITLNFYTSLNFIVLGPLIAQDTFYFNFNQINGTFGWIHHENIFYSLIVVSLVNGVGTLGF